jgi:hypothetical protein
VTEELGTWSGAVLERDACSDAETATQWHDAHAQAVERYLLPLGSGQEEADPHAEKTAKTSARGYTTAVRNIIHAADVGLADSDSNTGTNEESKAHAYPRTPLTLLHVHVIDCGQRDADT